MARKPFPYRLPLKYADGAELMVIYEVDFEGRPVTVVSDTRNGTSEWCVETPDGLRFSDCGYGTAECAC